MNKLKMKSSNITNENIEKIGALFPNVIVESEKGKAIDFDLLKQELSAVVVEGSKEKYQLSWPGKKESIVTANTPTTNILRPLKEKSVDFANTENIYIEGDNLEALKILQESYLNKIKLIYIDPPYNTGNDFIYNDNFKKSTKEELLESGQIDEEGNRLVVNSESNGKFHSDWLSMMYPRLKLARNLLTDDGVIFISIDDNEVNNLKKICDEIFGENNFVNCITVKMSDLSGPKMAHVKRKFPKIKEYLLMYKKSEIELNPIKLVKKKWDTEYKDFFVDLREEDYDLITSNEALTENQMKQINKKLKKIISINEAFKIFKIKKENQLDFCIKNSYRIARTSNSTSIKKYLMLQKEKSDEKVKLIRYNDNNQIVKLDFDRNAKDPRVQYVFAKTTLEEPLGDIWSDINTSGLHSEGNIRFANGKKPQKLLHRVIESVTNETDIIMDFFSGSASLAEAILALNAQKNLKRKFILVQIPEKCDEHSEAHQAGYKTICDIGEERIRRVGKKIKEETKANIDYGFRVYKIDSSNMKDVYYKPYEFSQEQLDMFETNIKEDRTEEDLLTQIILDLGLTLDLKIEEKNIYNNKVFFVDHNSLVACFDDLINIDICEEICKTKPLKVVFKDSSFQNDNDKINVEERIKKLSPDTEVHVI